MLAHEGRSGRVQALLSQAHLAAGVVMMPIEPRRIMQTEFGRLGNCQSACLAMMLGCELADVPNFAALGNGNAGSCYRLQSAWLAERGLQLLTIVKYQALPWPPLRGFYIAGGVSPRGYRHAVVYSDGALWHDPHPDGGGIAELDDVDFVVPLAFRPALSI